MIGSIHVLLVEDNAADVDLTRETLASTTFDIKLSVARDGVEAIDFLSDAVNGSAPGHPTLILLDLNLPRKDGRQVLGVLKGQDEFRRIPVIILSSSDSEKDITSCYNLGANCYIVKPVAGLPRAGADIGELLAGRRQAAAARRSFDGDRDRLRTLKRIEPSRSEASSRTLRGNRHRSLCEPAAHGRLFGPRQVDIE